MQPENPLNRIETFQQFLASQSAEVSLLQFLINVLLAAALAFVLGQVFVRFGSTLSNRRSFARNFVPMTATTTLIISVVKSSLALSLGLVGALSIVRFRAAIKEPEELTYLFLCIAIGLGFGADQRLLTVVAFAAIVSLIVLVGRRRQAEENENLHFTVTSPGPDKVGLDRIVATLTPYCTSVDLKRFDETPEALEASFVVEFENLEKLSAGKEALRRLSDSIRISFLDVKGVA
jgi:hypothetical protein